MRIKFHKYTVNFTANYAPKGPKTPNEPIEKFRNYTPMGLNRTQPIPCRKEVLVSLRERRGTLRLRPVATYAHVNSLESRQGPTAQRSGEQGAARIRDMAVAEVEALEGLEHAGHGRGDQGGQALVADLVAEERDVPERGQLAQRTAQG